MLVLLLRPHLSLLLLSPTAKRAKLLTGVEEEESASDRRRHRRRILLQEEEWNHLLRVFQADGDDRARFLPPSAFGVPLPPVRLFAFFLVWQGEECQVRGLFSSLLFHWQSRGGAHGASGQVRPAQVRWRSEAGKHGREIGHRGGGSSSSQIRKRCVRYKSCCNVSLHLLLRLDGRLPLRRLAVRRWFEEEAPLFCSKRWRRWRWRWSCCETPSSTDSKALRRGSPLPLSLRSIRLRSVDCKGAAKKGAIFG